MMMKSLKTKLTMMFIVFAGILSIAICLLSYYSYKHSLTAHYATTATNAAQTAADIVNGDKVEGYYQTKTPDEEYYQVLDSLNKVKASQDMMFLYVLVPITNEGMYIYDCYAPEDDMEYIRKLGDTDVFDEIYDNVMYVYKNGSVNNNLTETDGDYGHLASGYAPVKDSTGKTVAVVGADLSMDQVQKDLWNYVLFVAVLIIVIVVLVVFSMLILLGKMVINPINLLEGKASKIAENIDSRSYERVEIKSGDEIQVLADTFNKMSEDLIGYMNNLEKVTAEKERISAELDVAKKIQASMLPSIFPAFPQYDEIDLYATMNPAKEVGGDFYDFFKLDQNRIGIVMADVSGKGVPAALFMVIAKTLIKNHAAANETPSEIFTNVNAQLCENNDEGMFVTCFMGILEIDTGKFVYVNAGHNPPLLKKKDGLFEYMKIRPGFILAGMEGMRYKEAEIQLDPGDILYLYTDGVTEALNRQNELYSDLRLKELLNGETLDNISIKDTLTYIRNDIVTFADGAEQADDITMLILKMNGGN